MHFESRMTWEKLALELELIATEDPSTLAPVLMAINSMLWPTESQEWTHRTLSFMSYELQTKCEHKCEADRLHVLNEYFFHTKCFQIQPHTMELQACDLLIKPVLTQKAGCCLPVSMVYLHLASALDLPIHLIHANNHYLLKWVRGGKSCYIDLNQNGYILNEQQMAQILQKSMEPGKEPAQLDVLPARLILTRYIHDVIRVFEREKQDDALHIALNILLKLEPNLLTALAKRAAVRRRLSLTKESLADLKRYFSFVEFNQAPAELQSIFYEIQTSENLPPSHSETLH